MKALDRFIQKWRIKVAVRHAKAGGKVLDIGCYDGRVFDFVPGGPGPGSVGVDFVLPDVIPQRKNVEIVRGAFPEALTSVAGGHDPFDTITLLAVLEHIPDAVMPGFSKAIAEHLKPGGRLLITVPGPAVDAILAVLTKLRLIDGMSLEEHHGFQPSDTPKIFSTVGLKLVAHRRFQLGLNNLYVFER